ncbi:MAG: DNA replication and repair protein RecF [Stenotrophomonas maltophilia]|nr:MAG: DNA replication and repair protein RecF [Stenotrophomonas maltophilia]
MLQTLAIAHYRSLHGLVLPLQPLNVITGDNGSGKSNLYRALRLLAETAQGGVAAALAREGGLGSALWAGPEAIDRRVADGRIPLQGGPRQAPLGLKLGFATTDFGYAVDLGYPPPMRSAFALDPQINAEAIWAGPFLRSANTLVERRGPSVRRRSGNRWDGEEAGLSLFESLFTQAADPQRMPEALQLRDYIRRWRFYDHFRSDADAPARQPAMATRTPVLYHDGRDLAAAWVTILEIGDPQALAHSVEDAFPGATVGYEEHDGRLVLRFHQPGLLRPLSMAEVSDGTLRFLLLGAALHTPRPPPLLVLNEPKTSLHPDLLPALARLIVAASARSQVWVVSHASRLIAALEQPPGCHRPHLHNAQGRTLLAGQGLLDAPAWHWPAR